MAVRNFAADNSELRVPIVAASNTTGAVTVAALVKRNNTGTWQSMIAHHSSTGGYLSEFGFAGSGATNALTWGDPTTGVTHTSGTDVITSTTIWHLVAYTKPAGASGGRFHIFPFGGTWVHRVSVGANANNMPSQTGGSLRFGEAQDVDDLNARLALAGLWTAELTDAQIEALAANLRTADWVNHAVAPVGVWEFDQATATEAVPDLIGNHVDISGTIDSTTDTNGIAGTTIVTGDDPPGWVFGVGSPPATAAGQYGWGTYGAGDYGSLFGEAATQLSASDSIALSELVSGNFTPAGTDSLVFSTLASNEAALATSESGVLSDTSAMSILFDVADALALSESVMAAVDRATSDSWAQSESITATAQPASTDPASLSEALTVSTTLAVVDSILLSEQVTAGQLLELAASDSLTFTESLALSSVINLIDSAAVSAVASTLAEIGGLEALTLSDTSALTATELRSVADSATLADLAEIASALSAADAAALSELGIAEEVVAKSVFDTLTFQASSLLLEGVLAPDIERPTSALIELWAAQATLQLYSAAAEIAEHKATVGLGSTIRGAEVS